MPNDIPPSPALFADELRKFNERLLISSVREQESAEVAERQTAELKSLFEVLSDGVAIVDADRRIRILNGAARRILGIPAAAAAALAPAMDEIDALDFRAVDNTRLPAHRRPLSRALNGEGFVDMEVLIVHDSDTLHAITSGTSILANGRVSLAIVILRDVTELRRLERQREEYLALVSHDLRNPLNAIVLTSQSLKRSAADQTVVLDRAGRIEKNADVMTSIISELLESAKLEMHRALPQLAPCDFADVVGGAVERLDDEERKRVQLEVAGGPHFVVLADLASLGRAFGNLLTNALKYSRGPVEVTLERRGGEAFVEVIDHGVGIAPDSLSRLFERYYRVPTNENVSGFGLGLYITRLIAEAHGGHVAVRSELGKGSTFSMALPLCAAQL